MLALLFFVSVCVVRTMHILSHTNFSAASRPWRSLLLNKLLSVVRATALKLGPFLKNVTANGPTSEPKLRQDAFPYMDNNNASMEPDSKVNIKGTGPTVAFAGKGAGTNTQRRAQRTRHGRPAIVQMPTGGYNCAVM